MQPWTRQPWAGMRMECPAGPLLSNGRRAAPGRSGGDVERAVQPSVSPALSGDGAPGHGRIGTAEVPAQTHERPLSHLALEAGS